MSTFYRLSGRESLVALTLPVVNKVIFNLLIKFPFHSICLNIVDFTHGPIGKLIMFLSLEYPCYYQRGSSL